MKPIHLKLAGLQSYRQMQEIDFTTLCEMGLFGIFGPTGSGKSTILDAITLAMYGKVGRATNGTQGIMNQSEDSLFVAFTFELTSAKGKERYRVERRFKRTGDISISNTISRFIAFTEQGETVVADKLAEVTKCVEQKIGLKLDDFTRAVVLPQGKFAEFLSLKGVERRAMLQRLFHLEQYGDVLGQKVNRGVKEHEQQLRELNAEQQGLGAASFEQLEEIDGKWQIAVQYTKQQQILLEQAQQQLEQITMKRGWSRELEQALAQQETLQLQQAEVEVMQVKLARAHEAQALKSPLSILKQLEQQVTTLERELTNVSLSLKSANKNLDETSSALKIAKDQLSHNEPELLQRIDQLEQAQQLEKECESLQQECASMKTQLSRIEVKREQALLDLSKEEQLLVKAQRRKIELEQQALHNEVKPTERKLAEEALRKEQVALQLLEQQRIVAKEESLWRNKATQTQQQMSGHQQEQAGLIEQCRFAIQQLRELIGKQIQSIHEIQLEQVKLQTIHTQLHKLSQQEQNLRWASLLAADLVEGEPCRVCGSVHHPAPTIKELVETSQDELQTTFHMIQDALADLKQLEYRYERSVEQLVALIDSIGELNSIEGIDSDSLPFHNLLISQSEIAASIANTNEAGFAFSEVQAESFSYWVKQSQNGEQQLQDLERRFTDEQTVISQWTQNVKQLQSDWRKLTSAWLTTANEATTGEQRLQELVGQNQQLQEKLQQYHNIIDQCLLLSNEEKVVGASQHRERNQEPSSFIGPAALAWEEIERKDIEAEDIKQRLARSLPFIEQTTVKIGLLKDELVELDKQRVQLSTQLEGKGELLAEKQARLLLWTQGKEVAALLGLVRKQLEEQRLSVNTCEKQYELSLKGFHEQSKQHGIAEQALVTGKKQCQEQLLLWDQALASSVFKDEAEVSEAWMESDQIAQQAAQIEQHLNLQRELTVTIRDLQSKLGEERIDEVMWQQKQAEVAQVKEGADLAVRQVARLERDLEDIKHRHTRWQQLEQQKSKLEQKLNLLIKLQSALRGNAFVEYIAEEQLMNVSRSASERLKFLTNQRYALESDSGGGFVIRDDANGGVKRPVGTLSGGETFLTSLALALALSAQIQLRGQYPLQFFFLDEGFGTLDPELLDTVITSLEHLHHEHLAVGVISHVAELRSRLPRKLIVVPAESGGDGSKIVLEKL